MKQVPSKMFCLVLLVFSKGKEGKEVPNRFPGPREHSPFGKSNHLFLEHTLIFHVSECT